MVVGRQKKAVSPKKKNGKAHVRQAVQKKTTTKSPIIKMVVNPSERADQFGMIEILKVRDMKGMKGMMATKGTTGPTNMTDPKELKGTTDTTSMIDMKAVISM
jgi:hypothetical protein